MRTSPKLSEMRGGGLQVLAKASGTATITVKTEDGGKTAECRVTVNDAFVDVAGVTIDPPSKNMLAVGESGCRREHYIDSHGFTRQCNKQERHLVLR